MAFAPGEGSLASLFQLAYGNLQHLRSHLSNDRSHLADYQRCTDELGRLDTWDTEICAQNGGLDYTLRHSSRLRSSVRELLQDLAELNSQGGCLHVCVLQTLI